MATGCLIGLVIATACESTKPWPSVIVGLTMLDGPFIEANQDLSLPYTIRCDVTLGATLVGQGSVRWGNAVLRAFAGSDTTAQADSAVIDSALVQSAWGDGNLFEGSGERSKWSVAATVPFTAALEFHYRPNGGGSEAVAKVKFICGPPKVPGPPPQITALTANATSNLNPGDTLVLDFSASSAAGLWQTIVSISGACSQIAIFNDSLKTTVSHRARLVLPLSCGVGQQLLVNVSALDMSMQMGTRGLTPSPTVVDSRPPTLGVNYNTPWAGIHFVGDTIAFQINAQDNHALRELYWEVLPVGLRDSMPIAGMSFSGSFRVVPGATWAGPMQVLSWARDSSGNMSDTTRSAPDSLVVYPTGTYPTTQLSLPGGINGAVFSPDGSTLYVLEGNLRQLAVVSVSQNRVIQTIALPGFTTDIDVTQDGRKLVMMLGLSSFGVMDLAQASPQVTQFDLGLDSTTHQFAEHLRVASNGKAFVNVSAYVASAVRLLEVNTDSGTHRPRMDAGDSGVAAEIGRSPNGKTILVTAPGNRIQRYDASTDRFGPLGPVTVAGAASMDSTGHQVLLGLGLYDSTLTFVRTVRTVCSCYPSGSALAPDDQLVYSGWPPLGILRSRVGDGSLSDLIRLSLVMDTIILSPDGATVVTYQSGFSGPGVFAIIHLR